MKVVKVLLVLMLCLGLTACGKSDAEKSFDQAVESYQKREATLDKEIKSLKKIIKEKGKPLDEQTMTNAMKAVKDATNKKYKIPDVAKEDEEIKKQTNEINNVKFDETIKSLKEAGNELSDSRKQLVLVTNPKEKDVLTRLNKVKNIDAVEAVTEDNDSNGHLNKAGGYTTTVYFYSHLVSSDKLTEPKNKVIENGTDGGGAIEVYANVEDANKRNTYLSSFDRSAFSSGSHEVFGTCVVRTSDNLTASQQKSLTKDIVTELTRLY